MVRKCVAEMIGTFALVFAGTGAVVVNDVSGETVTHVGVALTFRLVVMAMIYAVGDVSGAPPEPHGHLRLLAGRPTGWTRCIAVHSEPGRWWQRWPAA